MAVRKYDYQEIAMIQLTTSIELYDQGNYISSLNLASAAEEIFGGMVTQKDLKNMNELRKDIWVEFSKRQGLTIPSEKVLSDHQNRLKNSVKHFNDGHEKYLNEFTIRMDARMFIYRALHNYMILTRVFPEGDIFKKLPKPF